MVEVNVKESGGMNPRIKEGTYAVRLGGIVERILDVLNEETKVVDQIPRFEWVFGLRTSEGDKKFTALTSPTFSTKSKAFAFSKALRDGKPLDVGKKFNTDDLIGMYATAVVVDRIPKKPDRLGQINITSEITALSPIAATPEVEISIDGIMDEEEVEEEQAAIVPPVPPVQQAPPVPPKKTKK